MDRGNRRQENERDQSKQRSRVFTPVTSFMIEQLNPGPDDVCEFSGEPISEVAIVGRLVSRNEQPMRVEFELNDNTGTVKLIFYQKGENMTPQALKNFSYA